VAVPPAHGPVRLAGVSAARRGILPATPHPLLSGVIAGAAVPVLLVLFTRHLPRFAKRATGVAAMLTSLWLPFLAAMGLRACLPALLITWAICTGLWVRHYRWRPAAPEKAAEPGTDDPAVWARLAARRKWVGKLADPEPTPDGGRKWQIQLDGIETHIGQVMSEPRALAAAWHKARTEVYVEPHPTGVESRGVLTILKAGTLETIRDWTGTASVRTAQRSSAGSLTRSPPTSGSSSAVTAPGTASSPAPQVQASRRCSI